MSDDLDLCPHGDIDFNCVFCDADLEETELKCINDLLLSLRSSAFMSGQSMTAKERELHRQWAWNVLSEAINRLEPIARIWQDG